MADPRDPKETSGSFLAGAVSGGILGLVVGVFLVSVVGYPYLKRKLARESFENLIPVVIASDDIPAGTVVTFDLLTQRSTPEQYVTHSVIRPDDVTRVIDQRITVPVRRGDMLLWSQFPSRKQTLGLVAAHDIPVGGTLKEADCEERELPPLFTTPSFVRQSERPQIVGRTVTAAFRKGDPILWTHLQNEPPPITRAKGR